MPSDSGNRPIKSSIVYWPIAALLLLVALFALRAWLVEVHFGQALACEGCFFLPSILHDLWLLGLASAILLVAVLSPWRPVSIFAGLCLSMLCLAFIADVYLLHAFGSRLFLADVALYGLNARLIFEQFSSWAGGPWPTAVILAALFALALVPAFLPTRATRGIVASLAIVGVSAALTAGLSARLDFVNSWIYENFLEANANSTESARYGEQVAQQHQEQYADRFPARCTQSEIDRRNVVILIVESYSSYQSQAFGGHLDWTPALDEVAENNVRFTRVHAGGFSTVESLVNILGGVRIWAPFQHLFNSVEFSNAWGIENSLVRTFRSAGHYTAFLTTSPLNFLEWGKWLKDVGFEYVEGNQHPFYADWPKVSFQAAADEALYKRALQWMDDADDEPYLLVLETVSTHQPFIHPESGEYDIESTFGYADRWAAWFHEQLESRGYYDDGILLILGDHRSMTPISPEERERFGDAAASLTPLILVDRQWSGPDVVDRVHGQADLLPGFRQRLTGEVCLDSVQTAMFEDADAPPGCALHLKGTPRGVVDVFCDGGAGRVRLDGEDTRFVHSEGLSESRREALLNVIAVERLRGLDRVRRESDE